MSQSALPLLGVRPPSHNGRRADDDYYTPKALVDVLLNKMFEQNLIQPRQVLCDPHAGSGVWLDAFEARGYDLVGTDNSAKAEALKKYPKRTLRRNFLNPWCVFKRPHWIIGNPPYNEAERHVRQALDIANRGVAFLLRVAFLSSQHRLPLFRAYPPSHVWVLPERPSFTGGQTDKYDYAFFIWKTLPLKDRFIAEAPLPNIEWVSWR